MGKPRPLRVVPSVKVAPARLPLPTLSVCVQYNISPVDDVDMCD